MAARGILFTKNLKIRFIQFNRKIIVLLITLIITSQTGWSNSNNYWPTTGWKYSTPEEQGMSSKVLSDMLSIIMLAPQTIDSVTIVKNGYIVMDTYFYPFKKRDLHIIHSCTKSITSTIMGIAIEKGFISDTQMRVIDIFPEVETDHLSDNKKKMTIEHLLTMSAGMECKDNYAYKWEGLEKMRNSPDWTKYMLELPMNDTPGNTFEYCNGASYLLAEIIQKKTGERSFHLARKALFNPLGITNVYYAPNRYGDDFGYGRMWMTPHDMAKFGWLFLNNGKWEGKTIVPEGWVKKATAKHIDATLFDGYGYQWWIHPDYYVAVGYGGQRIFVSPKYNLVAVFTSFQSRTKPDTLMSDYIIKAIQSDKPLPPDKPEFTRLTQLNKECASPGKPSEMAPLPPIAKTISNVRYKIDKNMAGFTNIMLTFNQDENVAVMEYGLYQRQNKVIVGLDDVFRITHLPHRNVAFKGCWIRPDTFEFLSGHIGNTLGTRTRLKFTEDQIEVDMLISAGGRFKAVGKKE